MLWLVIMNRQKKDQTDIFQQFQVAWSKTLKSSSNLRDMEKILERLENSCGKLTGFLSILFIVGC